MSWWGGGLISVTPGVAWRSRAMNSVTLKPGSWPPSPGLAPCATLISISSHAPRYSAVTPKRRSEEHTSELQSLMRISYAVFCLKKKKTLKDHILQSLRTVLTESEYEYQKTHRLTTII